MSQFSPVQKEFEDIRQSGDFERLNPYKDPQKWSSLSSLERETLAQLFITAGKHELDEMRQEAFRHFKWAEELVPENRALLFRIAEVYLQQKQDISCLKRAYQLLERMLADNSSDLEIRLLLAKTIAGLGLATEEPNLIQNAQNTYQDLKQIALQNNQSEILLATLWGQANASVALSSLSEEADDIHQALQFFRQTAEMHPTQPCFWIDYSECLWHFAQLVGDRSEQLMEEGLQCCDSLLNFAGDHPLAYYHMARWWQDSYESSWNNQAFEKAQMYFEAVVSINHQVPSFWTEHGASFWLDWGRFLTTAGKWKRDFSLLEKAGEKFEQAQLLANDQPAILNGWAEVLILMGSEGEHYELLREAEQKLIKSLELQRDIAKTWILLSVCYYELGQYFSDERYFSQAQEKIQFALLLSPNHPDALHVLALVHHMLGELWSDLALLEKSHEEFAAAAQHGASISPQFWNDWGICCLKIGELTTNRPYVELAVEKFEHCIECYRSTSDSPPFPEWLYHYGCALDFLGDLSGELIHYEKAVDVLEYTLGISQDVYVRFSLALAFAHLGEVAEDLESFCKACELFQSVASEEPEDEHLWNEWGVALINMAELLFDPVQPEKAQEFFQFAETKLQRAIMLGNQSALYNLACCYSLNGNLTEAMECMERAEHYDALPPLQDLIHDEWLEPLRNTPQFQQFLNSLAQKKREASP